MSGHILGAVIGTSRSTAHAMPFFGNTEGTLFEGVLAVCVSRLSRNTAICGITNGRLNTTSRRPTEEHLGVKFSATCMPLVVLLTARATGREIHRRAKPTPPYAFTRRHYELFTTMLPFGLTNLAKRHAALARFSVFTTVQGCTSTIGTT